MDEISVTPSTNIGSCPSIGGSVPNESTSSPQFDEDSISHPEEPPTKKRKNARKSFVWDHFTKILPVVKPEHPEAKCHHCKAKVGCHPEHHGTSGMRAHLKRCLPYLKQQGQLDKTQSRLTLDASKATGSDKGVLKLDTYSEKEVRRWIAEYLIMDEMPFRSVQRLGFRKLVERLEPRFRMPTRFTIMKDCMELYMEERTKLKEVKSRMMGDSSAYKSTLDCIVKTLKNDGPSAFYEGFIPNFGRLGSWNVIMFLTLEQAKQFVKSLESSRG